MKTTYRVKDWDKHFENHESRKVKRSFWVPIPNRHDGKSYRRIASHPDGVQVFAGWILILEAASKMPERGVLADEDGPLDAEDLASMTGFPAAIFEAAFRVLPEVRIGWLEAVEAKPRRRKSPATSRNLPESPAVPGSSAVELNGTELQDTELQGTEGNSAKAGASAAPDPLTPQHYINRVLREDGLTIKEVTERAQRAGHKLSAGYVHNLRSGAVGNPSVLSIQALAVGLSRPEDEVFSVFRGQQATEKQTQAEFTIWKLAVGKLMTVGMEEQAARSFIGAQCKGYGKKTVADAITTMLAQEPADPKGYLVKVLQNGASNGAGTQNNEFRRTTAAERNNEQLKRNRAVVERLRREGGGDPDEVTGGNLTTIRR